MHDHKYAMSFLSPERDFASNKDFPPSSQPTAPFSLLSNLPILLSPITNARGPQSCLVCDVICFLFIAKGLGGLLFCFLEDLQQSLLFPISQRHWIQAKYMRRNLQTKVPGKHYVQPPQRRSTGTRAPVLRERNQLQELTLLLLLQTLHEREIVLTSGGLSSRSTAGSVAG